jgi:hypothetical protein
MESDYLAPGVYCESGFRPAEIIHEFDCSHSQECVRDRVEYFHALDYLSSDGPDTGHPSTKPKVSGLLISRLPSSSRIATKAARQYSFSSQSGPSARP